MIPRDAAWFIDSAITHLSFSYKTQHFDLHHKNTRISKSVKLSQLRLKSNQNYTRLATVAPCQTMFEAKAQLFAWLLDWLYSN